MLKFTLQSKRKAQNGSTSGSEAPSSPTGGSFTSSESSGSRHSSRFQVRDRTPSGSSRRPSSLAPSDDSEGKSPSETNSTSQDSDLGSFTMEINGSNGNRGRKNVSFEPKDTVYMIESAHDSSSGIASDEHNSSPNGHTSTSTSGDPTYGLPSTRPEPPPGRYTRNNNSTGTPGAVVGSPPGGYPNPAFRDNQVATTGYFPCDNSRPGTGDKAHALSPRARLSEPRRGAASSAPSGPLSPGPRCLSPEGRSYHRTFSPLTTEEAILNQRNILQYEEPSLGTNRPVNMRDMGQLISFGGGSRQHPQSHHHPNAQHQHPHTTQQHQHARRPYPAAHTRDSTSANSKAVTLFELLPDDVIIRIFSHMSSSQLCRMARVCRRWYYLSWEPCLWTSIRINGGEIDVDRALKVLTRRLSYDTPSVCVMVEKIYLNGCEQLTDKGLHTIAKRCPELRHLEVQNCKNISNIALFEVVSKCVNMEHLNVSGCPEVTCICLTPEATVQAPAYGRQIYLRFLDMTDCCALEDSGLQIIASYCPQLVFLYLRRCLRVTDLGVQYVANYCTNIREFSISDCRKVTDFGLRELAKLGSNLRYLSVAKCDRISDVGVKYIAQCCNKLRYLNVRGCEAVSDDAVELLAKFCKRLKSLDVGKCDITDEGLQLLAENCPQLRRLSLKSCDSVTDRGVTVLAYYCRQLQQLNIQDCQVSVESYRAVKKYCKRCLIEHTNPGFY